MTSRAKNQTTKKAAKASKSGLKALAPRSAAKIQGGKRTTVQNAHDKYANQ